MGYSTTEVELDETWINGSPVYERTFDLGATTVVAINEITELPIGWTILRWTCIEITSGGETYCRWGEIRPGSTYHQFYGSTASSQTYVYCKYIKESI